MKLVAGTQILIDTDSTGRLRRLDEKAICLLFRRSRVTRQWQLKACPISELARDGTLICRGRLTPGTVLGFGKSPSTMTGGSIVLEKILKLEGVGLFATPLTKAVELQQTTLIYADNGRGKSTLSAVLRACAAADVEAMVARATIGGTGQTRAQFRFKLPKGGINVTFDGGVWDAAMPNLMVFDQTFIERNVYAGGEVQADHHQSLLDFALGTAAVLKKKEVDDAHEAMTAATRARSAAEGKLQGYRGAMPVAAFLALPEEPHAEEKIASYETRIANANSATTLSQRAELKMLTLPKVEFDDFEAVLRSSFKQMHENAGALVKAHLQGHGGSDAQRWIGDGQRFLKNESCPFCGQPTEGLDIIEAYGTFFNAAYNEHNNRIQALPSWSRRSLSDGTIDSWASEFQANTDRAQAWGEQLQLDCPAPDVAELKAFAQEIRGCLEAAAEAKAKQPLEPLDTDLLKRAIEARGIIMQMLGEYNAAVEAANTKIAAFKKGLQAEDKTQLEAGLARVRAQKARHGIDVVAIVNERKQADDERNNQEKAKAAARGELDKLMSSMLAEYEGDINKWLAHLRTPFKISKLNYSYVGGPTPRTEYGVLVREKLVTAGKAAANAPSFSTVLSDGDKRSLALAFFLAKVLHEKSCADSIVVLDDVFASLDSNRRSQTIAALCEVGKKCAQIIVLAHDAYFLYELEKAMVEEKLPQVLSLQIRRVGEFSELAPADFSTMCESDYYKRYRTTWDYLSGAVPDDLLQVAQALRVLVEGNLHRRFPGLIRERVAMGVIIGLIESAPAGSPLEQLKPQVKDLRSFNEFAGLFHHDSQGRIARSSVTDGELHPFAKQAMAFVHLGSMS
ncbi:wobble nucleotide-excising tRNase [Variovorax boronicumulans]|uniref:AAA family ATPase n=1 Tax=Variovorax boronicumulans TaxID=436515 RepID=UPI0027864DAB|nr:AAA family ATPase [Variovorax boronicumulans]MDQ0086061.1 wobble nucleotide-excising tRNase [Variovorax boronicumulans]